MAVRNPLVALFMTLFETAIFAPLLCIPLLLFPYLGLPFEFEITLFWGVAAFAIAGGLAGRSGIFALAAFALTFLAGSWDTSCSSASRFPPRTCCSP